MKYTHDLSHLEWHVAGFTPYEWRSHPTPDITAAPWADVHAIPAPVPGSVQEALRRAGELPDWNVGLNARLCEWVENRHWIYQAEIPEAWLQEGTRFRLRCLGLDYAGRVMLNGKDVGTFKGSFTPYTFDLTFYLQPGRNVLQIIFEAPPRWLGQLGYTSQMTEWKPRFNYTWDWTARLVQTGIWDSLYLEVTQGQELGELTCRTDVDPSTRRGRLQVRGSAEAGEGYWVQVTLEGEGGPLRSVEVPVAEFAAGLEWRDLPVDLWWPNGAGAQPLYTLTCRLLDADGYKVDEAQRTVGFRHVEWRPCEGAPAEADPWLCAVNGRPVFLQGVNWTPIRPNFSDVGEEDYRLRLEAYRDLGCNLLRVWGGAYLEKAVFYRLCDELGLMVWQEFPLSSSGLDNWPPEDTESIEALAAVAESYIARRGHHVSLLLWCGGNELQGALDGSKKGGGKPVDATHPLIARLQDVVAQLDPGRRFLPTSSSGPRFSGDACDFGKGLHWDVHGPWRVDGDLDAWEEYWQADDALFRSETGAPGASPARLIRHYRGDLSTMPASHANPLWRRTAWWIEWERFVAEKGREPQSLGEYVAWSQARQAKALAIAARACKERFPRCGGFLIWMGHDSFPCTANTSIIDFEGNLKPAALAVREVFRSPTSG